jgi:hypothetical protein
MFFTWWWIWIAMMFLFCVAPMGYGWGYRGWGPPYPSYIQRCRHQQAAAGGPTSYDHYAWGWVGDLIWLFLIAGIIWFAAAFWWR